MRIVMRPEDFSVEPLVSVDQLATLEADCKADGRIMVSRFIQEWREGRNRFSLPGEKAYVARREGRLCAVCGLNRDPFASDSKIGRVRRLYVSTADRRNGIGTALMDQLMEDAQGVYTWVHLRTLDSDAAAFYEAIGFDPVEGNEHCTHRRRVA